MSKIIQFPGKRIGNIKKVPLPENWRDLVEEAHPPAPIHATGLRRIWWKWVIRRRKRPASVKRTHYVRKHVVTDQRHTILYWRGGFPAANGMIGTGGWTNLPGLATPLTEHDSKLAAAAMQSAIPMASPILFDHELIKLCPDPRWDRNPEDAS